MTSNFNNNKKISDKRCTELSLCSDFFEDGESLPTKWKQEQDQQSKVKETESVPEVEAEQFSWSVDKKLEAKRFLHRLTTALLIPTVQKENIFFLSGRASWVEEVLLVTLNSTYEALRRDPTAHY